MRRRRLDAGGAGPRADDGLPAALDGVDRVQGADRGIPDRTSFRQAPTLDNFLYVLTEVPFFRYWLNTLFVAGVVTVVALLFHSMAGYALARLQLSRSRDRSSS